MTIHVFFHYIGTFILILYYEPTVIQEEFHVYNDVLVNAIKKANHTWIFGCKFVKENITRQWNKYNCGIITLNNMSDLLLTIHTKKHASDDNEDRDSNRRVFMSWRQQFKREIMDH